MNNTEYTELMLVEKQKVIKSKQIDEKATIEVAQLVSGGFTD